MFKHTGTVLIDFLDSCLPAQGDSMEKVTKVKGCGKIQHPH